MTERPTGQSKIQTRELSKEFVDDAAEVWVEGLRPFWNWWIEEQAGRKPSVIGSKNLLGRSKAG